jgi:hypothetical protein
MPCGAAAIAGLGSVADPLLEVTCAVEGRHLTHLDDTGKHWWTGVGPIYLDGPQAGQPATTICRKCNNRPVDPDKRAAGTFWCPTCLGSPA